MAWVVVRLVTFSLETLADVILLVTPWLLWVLVQVFRLVLLVLTLPPTWVTLTAFLLLLGHVYYRRTFSTFHHLNIPGPKPLPLLGNLLPVLLKGVLRADKDLLLTYGNVIGTYEGHTPTLIVADPRLLKQIMIKQFHNFQDRRGGNMHEYPLRRALSSLRGQHWRHVRSLLTPTFSTAKLKNMVPLIDDCCHTLVTNLQKKAQDDELVDLKSCFGAFTMDVIASTAFGLHLDSQNDTDSPFVRHAKRVFNFRVKPWVMMVVLFFGPLSTWIIRKLKINFFPQDVTEFFVGVIDDVMKRHKDTTEFQTDFLKLMMNAQVDDLDLRSTGQGDIVRGPDGLWSTQGLTHEEIVAQSLLFFLAGYETTATTLSFAGYCLATHPDYQRRLVGEIDSVMKNKHTVDIEMMGKMTFLDMVVCETLRMYPPAGRITRVCCRDVEVEGVSMEKGMVIVIPIYSIHHDPDLWPDPHSFNPYRFSAESKLSREAASWIPFGLGPRQCIGIRLAMLEIKMALIFLLQSFWFDTSSKIQIPLKMKKRTLLQPETPILIKLVPRSTCPEFLQENVNKINGNKIPSDLVI